MIRTKKDVFRLEAEVKAIQERSRPYTEAHFNERIKVHWEKVKVIAATENLKAMPVDTISTLEKGMPINWLVSGGFTTIYDLADKSIEELMRINGVGEISAEAIFDAVSKIKASVYTETVPKIDPDNASEEELRIIESVYVKWELLKTAESLQRQMEAFDRHIKSAIEIAKKKKGFLGGLFQSKQIKQSIELAYDTLNDPKQRKELQSLQEQLQKIEQFTVSKDGLLNHFIEKNASYYTELEKVIGFDSSKLTDDLPTEIVDAVNAFPLQTTGLTVDLRHYQTFGAKYALHYKRTLLGDEMGLGKTIQGLALMNHLFHHQAKYSIVVCPLSVLANWKREIELHSNLQTYIFHGRSRVSELAKWQEEKGVLLTTYEHTFHLEMDDLKVDALIVDEAHYVKNPEAKRSQSVYRLARLAEYVLFMSGTPLENRLEEMKQLIAVLQPEVAESLSNELHLLQPTKFKETIAEVYLRRNRTEVLTELPELEIIPKWVGFGEEEKQQYELAVANGQLMRMRRAAWSGKTPAKSPKLQQLLEICEDAAENGHKVLIFSFFKDVIRTVHSHLEGKAFEAITGDVANHRRQEIIDEFTKAKPGSVLISQITAGGVGLNIQAANIVILCEPQWKPSIEEQAISRAYRMGQSRNVVVYRLLTEDSIDVSMLEVLGQKAGLFDLYARESDVASLALDEHKETEEKALQQKVLQLEKERLKQNVG